MAACDIDGSGEALLLLHGALLSRAMWRPQIEVFRSAYQVITCDLPAHGGSRDVTGDYTIAKLSRSVIQLLDDSGILQTHVCGHSLGGMVSQQLAVTHPGRIRKIVLAETAFGTRNSAWERLQSAIAQPILKITPQSTLVEMSARQYGVLNPQVGAFIRQEMARYNRQTSARVLSAAFSFSGKQQLKDIQSPTLVLVAEHNRRTHAQGVTMAAHIPNGTFETIPQAHHLLNLDNPDGFNRAVLAFLRNGG